MEALRPGDLAVLASGDMREIVWIGRRRYGSTAFPNLMAWVGWSFSPSNARQDDHAAGNDRLRIRSWHPN